MTTEVLRNMIYAGSSTLANLGFVVMDEVHYLADRFRGAVWEEVIIGLAESIQVVALSATVSNAEEFGEWLSEVRGEMAVVVSERRPVPLFQHVLVGHALYDLFADVAPTARADARRAQRRQPRPAQGRPGGVPLRPRRLAPAARAPAAGAGARRLRQRRVRRGGAPVAASTAPGRRPRSLYGPSRPEMVELLDRAALLPAIVFIFSRAGCDGAVRQLLGSGLRLTSPAEQPEIARDPRPGTPPGCPTPTSLALDYDRFAEAMVRGVAAHHAGLLPAFKECVEEAFVRGLIKVVFATETLALGINMPARSVVLEKLVKYNGESHADITPGEYTQLTGRAGRRGIDVEGHAVVLLAARAGPAGGRRAGLAADLPAAVLVRADLQHGGQPGRQRRPGAGPDAAGAVVRPVPVRPLGGRGGPGGGPQHRRRSPPTGPRRPATGATSRRTPGCGPRSPRWRPRRPGNGGRTGGPSRCRPCSP